MKRVLFVTNGHGEVAIADRIAAAVVALAPQIGIDHFALVGAFPARNAREVGPRKSMPSGGLVAMGNVRNLARDLRAGLMRLTIEQWRALRAMRGTYAVVVATGDAFALWMALRAGSTVLYVGTAKSVLVAPYGSGERRLLRRARAIFVRDEATAADLQRHGLHAEAPGNVIADIFASGDAASVAPAAEGFDPAIALLPGSRDTAYSEAEFLVDTVAEAAVQRARLGAVLSIAPGIDAQRMADALRARYVVADSPLESVPFEVRAGERVVVRAWRGEIGPLVRRCVLVLGQAGTANEAAAAAGVPVLAVERGAEREHGWYRHRQTQLLGDALVMVSPNTREAARQLGELLDDPAELARRGAVGRERMGSPGGARRIAERIIALASEGS